LGRTQRSCTRGGQPAGLPGSHRGEPGVNGDLSVVLTSEGTPFAVLILDIAPDHGGTVTGVYAVTNPDKLTHVDRPSTGGGHHAAPVTG
jgi:hypothetical protein